MSESHKSPPMQVILILHWSGAEILEIVMVGGGRPFDALLPRARLNLNNSGCWMGFA
jgi:hypothetical protein